MKARIISKNGRPIFAATGVKIVAMDHQTTPKPSTTLPPILSAHMPPAIFTNRNPKWGEEHKYIREGETISDNNELQLSFTLGVTNVLQNKDNNNDKKTTKKNGILHKYQNDWGQFKRAWLAGSCNESDDLSRLQKQ